MNHTPSTYPLSRECEECGSEFIVHDSKEAVKRFCNRSCSATFNNKKFPKRVKDESSKSSCVRCGKVRYGSKLDACPECMTHIKIDRWLSGEWDGAQPKSGLLSNIIRNHLIQQADNYCQGESCLLKGVQFPTHPSDNRSILEIDHINGNGEDHSPGNLRVLCPTCHTLTPTYRARNIGNGRKVFYHRRSHPEGVVD